MLLSTERCLQNLQYLIAKLLQSLQKLLKKLKLIKDKKMAEAIFLMGKTPDSLLKQLSRVFIILA